MKLNFEGRQVGKNAIIILDPCQSFDILGPPVPVLLPKILFLIHLFLHLLIPHLLLSLPITIFASANITRKYNLPKEIMKQEVS